MSVTLISEVRQRSAIDRSLSRELAIFVDEGMAQNVIEACYRELWGTVQHPNFIGTDYFPVSLVDEMNMAGKDRWTNDDKNSGAPLFFSVQHRLFNQVPATINNFVFGVGQEISPVVLVRV